MYTRPRKPERARREPTIPVAPRSLCLAAAACAALFVAGACSGDPETPENQAGAAGTARGGSSSGIGGSSGGKAGNSSAAGGVAGTNASGGSAGTAARGGAGGTGAGGAAGGGGTGNVTATGGVAGSATGGSAGSAGATGGSGGEAGGSGGSTAGTSGASGSAGSGGSGGTSGGPCPAGAAFAEPAAEGAVTKVMGVPPSGFGSGSSSNVEGAVWLDGSLYVSHIQEGVTAPPPARILKITGDTVEEFLRDSGSNGLAIAPDGRRLVAARHTTGSLSFLDLGPKTFSPLTEEYMDARFDSPNDVAVRSDGNVYFTDPDYQAPNPRPQSSTRVYRVEPGGAVSVVDGTLGQPNGVTLSPDEDLLYVSSQSGIRRYPVNPDGSTGTGASFGTGGSSDGMVVDCAGNLYLTSNRDVVILDPSGAEVTRLMNAVPDGSSTTNVAFGGTNRQRLFITARANAGLWYVDMNVPGFPY